MKRMLILIAIAVVALVSAFDLPRKDTGKMISKQLFGKLHEGCESYMCTFRNAHQVIVKIANCGATMQSVVVPDKSGKFADVALGYDNVE